MSDFGKMLQYLKVADGAEDRGCADGFCEPVFEDVPFNVSWRLHWNVGTHENPLFIDATVLKDDPTVRMWLGEEDGPTDFFVKADVQTLKSWSALLATIADQLERSS